MKAILIQLTQGAKTGGMDAAVTGVEGSWWCGVSLFGWSRCSLPLPLLAVRGMSQLEMVWRLCSARLGTGVGQGPVSDLQAGHRYLRLRWMVNPYKDQQM